MSSCTCPVNTFVTPAERHTNVLRSGISVQLQSSTVDARELEVVHEMLHSVHLSPRPDRRIMAWGPDTWFFLRVVYRVLFLQGCTDLTSSWIWASRLPSGHGQRSSLNSCPMVPHHTHAAVDEIDEKDYGLEGHGVACRGARFFS